MATGHVNVDHRLLYRAHFSDHVIVEILSSAHAYLNINYEERKWKFPAGYHMIYTKKSRFTTLQEIR